ncbi:unnamed protein product [Caenorhabditis auriculariae]|uniref:Uncharacterized protein n=1 Tax=Caenorhabditis auriculariae TaxID=2777116 RepID=A0A8S1HKP1_9PELO|nr:unnamed protein product [Caenorhabditis auriculariae]
MTRHSGVRNCLAPAISPDSWRRGNPNFAARCSQVKTIARNGSHKREAVFYESCFPYLANFGAENKKEGVLTL